jgi:predicted nucleic acid-binding protein
MIAVDTSTWVAFLEARTGEDVELLAQALGDHQVMMIPVVLTELLSDPEIPDPTIARLCSIPRVELKSAYWEQAGLLRAKVLSRGRRARLGDALVAESCITEGLRLLTRDRDFSAFVEAAGLELVLPS